MVVTSKKSVPEMVSDIFILGGWNMFMFITSRNESTSLGYPKMDGLQWIMFNKWEDGGVTSTLGNQKINGLCFGHRALPLLLRPPVNWWIGPFPHVLNGNGLPWSGPTRIGCRCWSRSLVQSCLAGCWLRDSVGNRGGTAGHFASWRIKWTCKW